MKHTKLKHWKTKIAPSHYKSRPPFQKKKKLQKKI